MADIQVNNNPEYVIKLSSITIGQLNKAIEDARKLGADELEVVSPYSKLTFLISDIKNTESLGFHIEKAKNHDKKEAYVFNMKGELTNTHKWIED